MLAILTSVVLSTPSSVPIVRTICVLATSGAAATSTRPTSFLAKHGFCHSHHVVKTHLLFALAAASPSTLGCGRSGRAAVCLPTVARVSLIYACLIDTAESAIAVAGTQLLRSAHLLPRCCHHRCAPLAPERSLAWVRTLSPPSLLVVVIAVVIAVVVVGCTYCTAIFLPRAGVVVAGPGVTTGIICGVVDILPRFTTTAVPVSSVMALVATRVVVIVVVITTASMNSTATVPVCLSLLSLHLLSIPFPFVFPLLAEGRPDHSRA